MSRKVLFYKTSLVKIITPTKYILSHQDVKIPVILRKNNFWVPILEERGNVSYFCDLEMKVIKYLYFMKQKNLEIVRKYNGPVFGENGDFLIDDILVEKESLVLHLLSLNILCGEKETPISLEKIKSIKI